MPRFFIPTDQLGAGEAFIRGSDAHHLAHVLRAKVGDAVTVCDMGRREHDCVITAIADGEIILRITATRESENEPSVRVTLYQGLPKADKLEKIVEKAVELGVGEVVPVEAERSVAKVGDSFAKKLARLGAISLAASKQCGRAAVPAVREPIKFAEAARLLARHEFSFVCYEGSGVVPIKALLFEAAEKKVTDVGFYIGPEGGVSSSELALVESLGIPLCGLGKRILRTETASGCVLSALMLVTGNL